jgi:pyruvate formate-lyase activating enzyme-like uncharacterized protein
MFPRPHDIQLGFNDVKEYIRYLETFPFQGIGISGGEPFLTFDRLTEYIREVRKVFGTRHYIWMYTNGDLATEEHLAILEEIGLNEIRFDLAATDYNLTPVKLALKHIDTVTIEIPAIPEDVERVKKLLPQFEAMGVKHLVLHQLMATEYNRAHFVERGYSFCKSIHEISVPESELAAFALLKYAIESKIHVGINYCSLQYKEMFQDSATRNRHAPLCQNHEESITRTGFLRRFSFEDSVEGTFSPQQLERAIMAEPYRPIEVTYYHPRVKVMENEPENDSKVLSFGSSNVIVIKSKYAQFKLANRASALLFHALFIENKGNEIKAFSITDEGERADIFEFIKNFRRQLENLEYHSEELLEYEEAGPM